MNEHIIMMMSDVLEFEFRCDSKTLFNQAFHEEVEVRNQNTLLQCPFCLLHLLLPGFL